MTKNGDPWNAVAKHPAFISRDLHSAIDANRVVVAFHAGQGESALYIDLG